MVRGMTRVAVVALLTAGMMAAAGCAQQVGDIDRTNPNKIKKELFDDGGEWYFRQTAADVSHGNPFFFTGINTGVEKVRWEIQEEQLVAYRSYEIVPGADHRADTEGVGDTRVADINDVDQGSGQHPDIYKGAPLIGFGITSHFDVQRGYSSATGEQTNVISENTSDRNWPEREYMRVAWESVTISNMSIYGATPIFQFTQAPGEEYEIDSRSFEYDDDGKLVYFEVRVRATLVDHPYCYYYELADCAGTEMTIVNSFARVPERKTYEAVTYDNEDMFKFGYFRSERFSYDRERGLTRTGQIFLANRHNIWETAYDAAGELMPVADRKQGHVVYYVNQEMPEDLGEWNKSIERHWDRAFRRSVAAAKGEDIDTVDQVFVVCHNPVRSDDHTACGEEGKIVRVGDVRYNHIYWVVQPQISGPLGYGPSGTDPETGEIISGTAYVYGASVDTYASSGLDIVNLQIACQDDQESEDCRSEIDRISDGENIRVAVVNRLTEVDPRTNVPAELHNMPAPKDFRELMAPEQLAKFNHGVENPRPYDHGHWDHRMRQMKEHNLDMALVTDEMVREMSSGQYATVADAPADVIEKVRPSSWMNPDTIVKRQEERARAFASNNIMTTDFADDVVAGLAASLAKKYENVAEPERSKRMWLEIRGLIYQGVMLHEIGHTLGLRHNFQGSYDSLNYFDEYWALRKQNLRPVVTVADLFEVAAPTVEQRLGFVEDENRQLPGGIAEYGYSSIMDYGLRFNTDIHGIGKYDEAAIIYAYTNGYYGDSDPEGHAVARRGYVEVWNESAFENAADTEVYNEKYTAEDLLRDYDRRGSLAYSHPLEAYHYTTVANSFSDVSKIGDRRYMQYDHLRLMRALVDLADESVCGNGVQETGEQCDDGNDDYDDGCTPQRRFVGQPASCIAETAVDTAQSCGNGTLDRGEQCDNGGADIPNGCTADCQIADRPVEVPYMFCTDDWAGIDSSCQRWDHGADPYEQAKYVIDGYHDYYWFSNFARDSLTWSPYARVGRVYSRYMSYLTKSYQELFFTGSNDIMGTYRYMAALAGFNFLNELLMMPTYGNHVADSAKVLTPCAFSDEEEFVPEGGVSNDGCGMEVDNPRNDGPATIMVADEDLCSRGEVCRDLDGGTGVDETDWRCAFVTTDQLCSDREYAANVPMGSGRRPYTRYNYDAGYTYYYYPEESGHFYDFLGGVIAMIQSQVSVYGVDTSTDSLSYSLPYYLFFDTQLADMVGASWLERPQTGFGQILVGDRLTSRAVAPIAFGTLSVDPATGMILDGNNVPTGMDEDVQVVRPYHGWGQRFYLMLYGMAGFNENYNIGFADENHIFRVGNGEQVDVGPGFSLVTCVDPVRGHEYAAIRNNGNSRVTTSVQFVQECQYWANQYNTRRSRLDFEGATAAERELNWYISRINLMRTYYDIFGRI